MISGFHTGPRARNEFNLQFKEALFPKYSEFLALECMTA